MIQQKTILTRPSLDVPWHWNVISRSEHAAHLEKNYIATGKILNQYEEIPNELTSIWYRFWNSSDSLNEYMSDPKVAEYDAAAKSYNEFANIQALPHEITTIS
jgi:hypothetical protein